MKTLTQISAFRTFLVSVFLFTIPLMVSAQESYKPDSKGTKREFTINLSSTTTPEKVSTVVIDNLVIFQGDIILGPLVSFEGAGAVAIEGASYRWPNSTIPFVISAGHPKATEINWAINHVNASTNLCIIARTTQADYIQFISGNGCASYVGRQGGRQDIVIGSCSQGSVAHEILHSAGLWHEQSREDRNSYVTINTANITAGMEHNFNRHVTDGIDIGTYDYGSIMHYGSTAFSKNGSNTIDIKIPPGTTATTIGQRTGLSVKDKAAINSLYGKGPCKEDCIGFNPANVTVRKSGPIWLVLDGRHAMYSTYTRSEADQIVKIIKQYQLNKSCFVGRPGPSFIYMLKGSSSPAGSMSGEDCISFNPANLQVRTIGGRVKITQGNVYLFDFGNKIDEANQTLSIIRQYGFTKTCYVGRPDPALQYMRK